SRTLFENWLDALTNRHKIQIEEANLSASCGLYSWDSRDSWWPFQTRTRGVGMFDLPTVQAALGDLGLDGWLLYDFRGLNILARRVLGLSDANFLSRRWFYFVPARGEPRKLLHRIEPHALDHAPGSQQIYLRWQEL